MASARSFCLSGGSAKSLSAIGMPKGADDQSTMRRLISIG
jgi:hypothetical protein